MKSDIISVTGAANQMEAALHEAEKVTAYKALSGKNALHLRLLTEEMMGLMRSITGEKEGRFWIEDQDGLYELHLVTETRLTSGKREKLLSAATSGKNESARGLMGRLRDFIERGADADLAGMTSPLFLEGMYEHSSTPVLDMEWSMSRYQNALAPSVSLREQKALDAWDELEKSVVARVADDVKVSIRGSEVSLTIYKKMT